MLERRLASVAIIFLLILSHYSCLAHISTAPTTEKHIKIVVFNQNLNDPFFHPNGVIKEVFYRGSSTNWESNLLVRDENEPFIDVKKYIEWNKDKQRFKDQPFFTWVTKPGNIKITIENQDNGKTITELLPLGYSDYYTDKLTPGVYKITASIILQEEREVVYHTWETGNLKEPDIPLYGSDEKGPWIFYKLKEISSTTDPPPWCPQCNIATIDYKLITQSYYIATGSTITNLNSDENEDLATVFVYTDWNKIRTIKPLQYEEKQITISDISTTSLETGTSEIADELVKKGFNIKNFGVPVDFGFIYIDYSGDSEYGVTRAGGQIAIAVVSAAVLSSTGIGVTIGTGIIASTLWDEILNVYNNEEIKKYIANGVKDDIYLTYIKKGDKYEVTLTNKGIDLYDIKIKQMFDSLSKSITTVNQTIKTGDSSTFIFLSGQGLTSINNIGALQIEVSVPTNSNPKSTSFFNRVDFPMEDVKQLPIDSPSIGSGEAPIVSFQLFTDMLDNFLKQLFVSVEQWISPVKKAMFGPSPEEIAVENAISEVMADMAAMSSLIESLNNLMTGLYQAIGQVSPQESRATFTYKIIDTQYFRDEARARAFMSSYGSGTNDIEEAIGIVNNLGLSKNGYVIVMVEATFATSSKTETARGPIICNERGEPYYKSWQFYQNLKEHYSNSQNYQNSPVVNPESRSTTTQVSGTYQGHYQYDGNAAKYPFTITLRQSGSTLSGTIRERRSTFGPNTQYLDSTLQGRVSGNSVYFVKTYAYDGHQVTYNGVYSSGTKQISGRWNIGTSGGAFIINT